jgi:rieske iron-sulfur protein
LQALRHPRGPGNAILNSVCIQENTDFRTLHTEYYESIAVSEPPWIGGLPMPELEGRGCCVAEVVSGPRRKIIQLTVAGLVAPGASVAAGAGALEGPVAGDRLVEEDAEGAPRPLGPADLPLGKPMLAFPFDAKTKAPRDGSRLNKVMLIRLAEADLDAATKARAAGGVLAFSAICTHQACDVKTWLTKEQVAVCFCHSSKFKLLDGGAVTAGPATRALPILPLKLEGEQLVVTDGFSTTPGGQPS